MVRMANKHQQEIPNDFLQHLEAFERNLGISVGKTDAYIATIEGMHGISGDLNRSVESHLLSIRKIRNTTEEIRNGCTESLFLIRSASK